MNNKGFQAKDSTIETPIVENTLERPLKPNVDRVKRVDINILKSKLQSIENKEFRKNMVIFIFFLILLGVLGIYLSI
jgi:hypothetical protein